MIKRVCQHCNCEFTPKTRHIARVQKFCSKSCSSKHYFGDGVVNKCNQYSKYRWLLHRVSSNVRHKRRELEYNLTVFDLEELDIAQNGKCALSGITLDFRKPVGPSQPNQVSVDRIDNTKGYIKDNIRLVCLMANYCRNGFTDQQVVDFCRSVVLNHSSDK